MATTPNLLSLPLEIRYQIYFYLLPDAVDNINIVRDDMDGPLKIMTNLPCQQIYHEVIQYYYSTKTFILDLTDPRYAPNRFVNGTKSILKYIRRVQNLRLVIGDVYMYASNPDSGPISEYAREQLDWFLRALGQANEDREGLWMRTMTVLDCCEITIHKEITKELLRRGEERRELLVPLLEPFHSRIRENLSIESRAQSRIRSYGDLSATPIGIVAVDLYTLKTTNSAIGLIWDVVVGVTHMNPSISLSNGNCVQRVPS